MAETDAKTTTEMSREERIAAAKAKAAERAKPEAGESAAKGEEGEEGLDEAASRFQALKSGQTVSKSRKEREAALLGRAVDISPRSGIEKLPQAQPSKAEGLPINRREFLTYAWGGALALIACSGRPGDVMVRLSALQGRGIRRRLHRHHHSRRGRQA